MGFILEKFIWKAEIKSIFIRRQLEDLLIMKLHYSQMNLNCDKSSAGQRIIYNVNADSIYIYTILWPLNILMKIICGVLFNSHKEYKKEIDFL